MSAGAPPQAGTHPAPADAGAPYPEALLPFPPGRLAVVAITRHGRVIARLVPDAPRMASDVFRAFWGETDIDFEAPPDQPAEPVESVD